MPPRPGRDGRPAGKLGKPPPITALTAPPTILSIGSGPGLSGRSGMIIGQMIGRTSCRTGMSTGNRPARTGPRSGTWGKYLANNAHALNAFNFHDADSCVCVAMTTRNTATTNVNFMFAGS